MREAEGLRLVFLLLALPPDVFFPALFRAWLCDRERAPDCARLVPLDGCAVERLRPRDDEPPLDDDEPRRLAAPPDELRPLETDISTSSCSTPTSAELRELSGVGPLLGIAYPNRRTMRIISGRMFDARGARCVSHRSAQSATA